MFSLRDAAAVGYVRPITVSKRFPPVGSRVLVYLISSSKYSVTQCVHSEIFHNTTRFVAPISLFNTKYTRLQLCVDVHVACMHKLYEVMYTLYIHIIFSAKLVFRILTASVVSETRRFIISLITS